MKMTNRFNRFKQQFFLHLNKHIVIKEGSNKFVFVYSSENVLSYFKGENWMFITHSFTIKTKNYFSLDKEDSNNLLKEWMEMTLKINNIGSVSSVSGIDNEDTVPMLTDSSFCYDKMKFYGLK